MKNRNADPTYFRLLQNAQRHLLDSYETKFGEQPDFEAIAIASEAAAILVDPTSGTLPDGSHPTKFVWVEDQNNKKRKIIWG